MKDRDKRWFLNAIKQRVCAFEESCIKGDCLHQMNAANMGYLIEDTISLMDTRDFYLQRYPRICAHIIAESLGYAVPIVAAIILKDSRESGRNNCEWVASCYGGDAKAVVSDSIRHRHHHKGPMAEYDHAIAIVRRQLETGDSPVLASWF
jgi:hypothetical protein